MTRPSVRLIDVASIDVGFPFKSAEFTDDPGHVRLLRGDNVAQGQLRWDNAKRLPPDVEVDERYRLRVGDSVVAMDRPWIGAGLKRATVRAEDVPALLVQRVARLRASSPQLHQHFLNVLIDGAAFSDYLVSVQTGTAVPHISASQIGAFRFQLPEMGEQQAIAEVLGALDDKIAANAKLVANADILRTTKFLALDTERSAPLSSVARFVNGRAFTRDATGTGRVVIRIAELNSGLGGSTVRTDLDVADDHLARPGSILFAWSGSLVVKRWFRDEAIVNQHIFNVRPNAEIPTWLAFELVESKIDDFRLIAANKATTMGHIQRRHLDEPVRLPSAAIIAQLDGEMAALWRLALNLEQESERLSALRDALLPELMSGRLRVKDAERAFEGAV